MRAGRLFEALKKLGDALHEANAALEEMRGEHDPLAVHIFVARRSYRNVKDTKSGKRSERAAWDSYREACQLGFKGSCEQWRQLLGAFPPR